MSLSVIKAVTTSNESKKKQTYYLHEFETKGLQDAKDGDELGSKDISVNATVTLTWTKNKGDAKLIHHSNGVDFVNRLPKSDNCVYSVVESS